MLLRVPMFRSIIQNIILQYTSHTLSFVQGVQLKSEPYFNMSNLFTKICNVLYYTTNPFLQ